MIKETVTVLVTGAEANTGFATVRRFAADGARVFLHAPTLERAGKAAAQIRTESGLVVRPIGADFRKPDEIELMMTTIDREAEGLDVLINNAVDLAIGHGFLDVPFKFMTDAVAVNLTGLFLCSQLAARLMARRRRGVIINLGSITSDRVTRNRAVYVATKGAIDSLTRAMAVELGPLGIRVNCVAPGHIHTSRWLNLSQAVTEERRANIPLGRESTPEDIADAIHFLASDQARSITGARLPVDGGSTAQLYPIQCDI
jgi:NAD(P)-dependent dehydrogenase (short-subunit alcohol dehydrogenase family)